MNATVETQIREFEKSAGHKLPRAYLGFLARSYGDPKTVLRQGFEWASDYKNLQELTTCTRELMAGKHEGFALAPNDFVFLHHGDQFLYFRCEGGNEDPPVWSYITGEPGPKQVSAHFSDWAPTTKPADQPGLGRSQKAKPPADAAHSSLLDIGEFITPELQAELRRAESRFAAQLAEAQAVVSWPLGAFKPAKANLVAALILSAGLTGLGLTALGYGIYVAVVTKFRMPLAASEGMSLVIWLGIIWLSGGLACGGAYFIFRTRQLLVSRLIIAAHGLSWVRPAKAEPVAWQEIWQIQEFILRESLPLNRPLRFLLPKSRTCKYVVHTKDGRRFTFSANTIREIDILKVLLRRVASDLQITWTLVRRTI